MSFLDKVQGAIDRNKSRLCVGLDPVLERLPTGIDRTTDGVLAFNRAIIDATADLACAYKPNLAFYEALGVDGWRVLRDTIKSIPPHVPVIGDAKRADIGTSAQAYASAIYDTLGCDACTVNPYMGFDAIEPFIARPGTYAFVLCRTSNPGARQVQERIVDDVPLYEHVARLVAEVGGRDRCGLVVGATNTAAAARIASAAPELWILSPGVGVQGGDLYAMAAALGPSTSRTIWNVSRGITAEGAETDYALRARANATTWREQINAIIA